MTGSRQRTGLQPRSKMFLRMLLRGALVRRGRALSALLAIVVAAAAATAMLSVYVDVQAKLGKEFRKYGANVVVVAKPGQTLPPSTLSKVEAALAGRGIAVPFAYVVASTSNGSPIVVAGTDMKSVQQLDSWWAVSGWPKLSNDALVGTRAVAAVSPDNRGFELKVFELKFQGRSIHLNPAGTLQTGAAEDSRIYLALAEFAAWTGVQPSVIEVAANGNPAEVNAVIARIAQVTPEVEVRPVRQIVEAEGRVLGKTRSALLASAVLIIITAALCLVATLTSWVLDRRRDFAIMKALGASERLVGGFFAAEAMSLGGLGALLGFVIGLGVAEWIGHANFHAGITPRLGVLPIVFAASVAVAFLSAQLPLVLLRRVQPAAILRGE